ELTFGNLRPVIEARLDLHGTTPAHQSHRLTVLHAESLGIVATHLDVGARCGVMKRGNALRHRATAPMLEHRTRGQPERELAARRFHGRVIRTKPDPGAMIGVPVEIERAP